MSYKFSEQSRMKLSECHKDLQTLFNKVIEERDCIIICGNRGKLEQNKAFSEGKSKLKFPLSKHNKYPSLAVDVMPYPLDWTDIKRVECFAQYVLGVAKALNINVRWGGDWNNNGNLKDDKWDDLPHWELA